MIFSESDDGVIDLNEIEDDDDGVLDLNALGDSFAKVRSYCEVLGIAINVPHLTEEDKKLYAEYDEAKANKDFAKSDALRAKMIEKGIF